MAFRSSLLLGVVLTSLLLISNDVSAAAARDQLTEPNESDGKKNVKPAGGAELSDEKWGHGHGYYDGGGYGGGYGGGGYWGGYGSGYGGYVPGHGWYGGGYGHYPGHGGGYVNGNGYGGDGGYGGYGGGGYYEGWH